ncbi:tetratricopeptide repeat protein [Dechloromonas denitrificans]|uniref:tetratricopeptide repeat protein n=1 Tax=Dechloromonas denitrificans TaxID=281362 RepID=UPI001CF80F64|nr:tetratricopeptide repeat protein [Dechloromonas denitrificans]UCV04441.1 tetratricopeptide repeat protein [Dechloromonas denitrificans]
MSLLMDALKRAETSKQEATRALTGKEAAPPVGEGLSLEPISTGQAKAGSSPLPDLATHLDAVDADLASAARPDVPPRPRASPKPAGENTAEQSGRNAVRNAFMAKQTASKPSKGPLWLALGTLGIAGLAIAAYVWFQLNSMGNNSMAPPVNRAPAMAAPTPPAPVSPPPAFATSPQPTAQPPADSEARLFPSPSPERRPERVARTAPEAGPGTPIRLARTRPEPDSNLLQGHADIQRNDLDLARRNFEKALGRDPNNTDALLALAAIAQRQGQPADAEELYRRALVANPSDAAVQAAVLNGTTASADPLNTESRLKTLLAAQPESAPLNFALGNLLSRQKRWSEAQQLYFNAVAAESDNPDYLFNLAVSLDHLRQSRPAAQHYRLALEAAEQRPAAFDRAQVKKRLLDLQPERQP